MYQVLKLGEINQVVCLIEYQVLELGKLIE